MACTGENWDTFLVTKNFRDQPRLKRATTIVPHFSLVCIAVSSNFRHHFEELKILNPQYQAEVCFHIHYENCHRTIIVFFGHEEMATQKHKTLAHTYLYIYIYIDVKWKIPVKVTMIQFLPKSTNFLNEKKNAWCIIYVKLLFHKYGFRAMCNPL